RGADQQLHAIGVEILGVGTRASRIAALVGGNGAVARGSECFDLRCVVVSGDAKTVQHENWRAVVGTAHGDIEHQPRRSLDLTYLEHRKPSRDIGGTANARTLPERI